MKAVLIAGLLIAALGMGCAHSPGSVASPEASKPYRAASVSREVPPDYEAAAVKADPEAVPDGYDGDEGEVGEPGEVAGIADPLEPFNRAMYHFNDRLYFWVLKPVAQGYSKVVPTPARLGVRNFFSNLGFPVRFVNCLLQANVRGATRQLGRFLVNTIWGLGGFLDPAASEDLGLTQQDEDLGQTLGVYGLGQGFFINWPIFGPSSVRDTVGMAGDFFLGPLSYVRSGETAVAIGAYGRVNDASLRIGDYESLKDAAIDPYIAIRDAYVQYRLKQVRHRGSVSAP